MNKIATFSIGLELDASGTQIGPLTSATLINSFAADVTASFGGCTVRFVQGCFELRGRVDCEQAAEVVVCFEDSPIKRETLRNLGRGLKAKLKADSILLTVVDADVEFL